MVDLVRHYREFKSVRTGGRLQVGNYHSQESRLRLADRYLADPSTLINMFRESVSQFREYNNPDESFVGEKRSAPSTVPVVEQITTGPKAAAYLARNQRHLSIDNLGEYEYIDREVVPARTTNKKAAAMANRFDDTNRSRSTTAMKADILLRSLSDNRPTIGEVKVSSSGGDDADPVYGLVQSLALASQLVSTKQRVRLNKHYPRRPGPAATTPAVRWPLPRCSMITGGPKVRSSSTPTTGAATGWASRDWMATPSPISNCPACAGAKR